jgi:Membrane-associating domain
MIFSAAVLGLSITLIKGQRIGGAPATTGYSAFLGGLGLVSSTLGLVTIFVHIFDHAIFPLAIDGLVTLLYIAGGVAMAIQLKGGRCTQLSFMANNKILNCGATVVSYDKLIYWDGLCGLDERSTPDNWPDKVATALLQRCQEATADFGLIFGMAGLSFIALGLGYAWRKKGNGGYVY